MPADMRINAYKVSEAWVAVNVFSVGQNSDTTVNQVQYKKSINRHIVRSELHGDSVTGINNKKKNMYEILAVIWLFGIVIFLPFRHVS